MISRFQRLPQFTLAFIVLSVGMTAIIELGSNTGPVSGLLISLPKADLVFGQFSMIREGEIWRLITPIFLHFSIMHIVFNMLWLWNLGGSIETFQSPIKLVGMVLVFGLAGNLAEYVLTGNPVFGGMSGVVYGLLGYVWGHGQWHPRARLQLPQDVAIMMLIWFALCWTGLLGGIANWAHTGGLLAGLAWAFAEAQVQQQRR